MDYLDTPNHWQYYHGAEGGNGLNDANWGDGSLLSWQTATPLLDHRGIADGDGPSQPFPSQPVWFPNYKGGRIIWLAGNSYHTPTSPDGSGMVGAFRFWESPFPWGPWISTDPIHTLYGRAALVTSGDTEEWVRVASFPQIIPTSVQDTKDTATAVVCCNGFWFTWQDPEPVNDYMFHVIAMQLSAGKPITTEPYPPGLGILSIITSSLPNGLIGTPYSYTLKATGGTPPYHWTSTALPAGLALNSSTGVISGTPTTAGTTSVTFTVSDTKLKTASIPLPMVIEPAPTPVSILQTKTNAQTSESMFGTSFDNPVTPGSTVVVLVSTSGGPGVLQRLEDNMGRVITPLFIQPFTGGAGAGPLPYTAAMAVIISTPSDFTGVTAIWNAQADYPIVRMIELGGTILDLDHWDFKAEDTVLTTWYGNYVPVVNNSLIIAYGINSQFGWTTVASPFQAIGGQEDAAYYYITAPIASPGIQAQFTVLNPTTPGREGGVSGMLVLRVAVVS